MTGLEVGDYTGLVLSSNALPPLATYSAFDLNGSKNANDFAQFYLEPIINDSDHQIIGSVTSLSAELVNPVPEASTVVSLGVMLGLGGVVLAVRRRRMAG